MFETSSSSKVGHLLRAAVPRSAPPPPPRLFPLKVALRSPSVLLIAAALIAVAVLLLPQQAHASSHDITGFSATPGSANNATLSWTAPSRSGITVDRYEIYWTPSSTRDFYQQLDPGGKLASPGVAQHGFIWDLRGSAWLGGSATSYTVTGLYGGIDYDFTIVAKGSGFNTYDANRNVEDQTNNTGEFQFVEDIAIAGPPHPFRSIDLTPDAGQIRAGWWLPRATKIGSSITKAQLQYKKNTSTNWITINFSSYAAWFPYPATPEPGSVQHSHTLNGLEIGTYNVRIRAGNSGGWSAYTQATATVPANPPTTVTVGSSDQLREGSGPATVTFTLDHPAHRELRAREAYIVLGDDRVNVSTPRFARGSRTATATITPINDNISNPCGSVAIKYLFSSGLRATVSFTIIDDDSATNRCTGRIGDGTPSTLTLERVELIQGDPWLRAYVLAKLNRPALDTRIVNVAVDGSSTATEGPYDWNGPNDFQVNGNRRLHILRGNVNARYTDNRGTHDWPTEIIINEDASDHETIVLRATSGSLTSNTLTLRVGELRRQAALQGMDGGEALPTAVTLALDAATVDEDVGDVTLTATLDAPAPEGGIGGFLFAGAEGTASEDIDFTMPLGIFIPGGQRSATATISITDDDWDEADETVVLSAWFDIGTALLEDKITLTITDDDTAGLTIIAASPLTVAEGGSASYTVVLTSQPTADVTVSASSDDAGAATVSPASHTFTPSGWNTPLTFTVRGLSDDDTDDERVAVSHSIASDDAQYSVLLLSGVLVAVSETTSGQQGAEPTPQGKYADLIVKMKEWRNDPRYVDDKAHTDRWDRALLAFGKTVADTTLTRMTATEAQGYADRGWTRWVEVAQALRELENRAPTVASAIGDAIIVHESGTLEVSLYGVFSDADNDALTITASSSDEAVATESVASDYSSLTVMAQSRGTATITVTADDGNGGTVSDTFTVRVKAAPVVASAISDVSGLEAGAAQEVSLSGVFNDADGDALTITATSSGEAIATATVAADRSKLTVEGVAEGTATITVTARDADGNTVSGAFAVAVVKAPEPVQPATPQETPNQAPTVSAAISDATIVNESGTHQVSLAGVFSDADSDSLTITAVSSGEAIATATVASDYSSLTVTAKSRGTATVTVTANDGRGGTVEDTFTVTVKAAPTVASAISYISGLTVGDTQDISLSGVFSDADGDAMTISAASSDDAAVSAFVLPDGTLSILALAEGTETITVTARDADGNAVSDAFDVTVVGPPTPVANLSCIAETKRVAFLWDAPEWSGGEVYAYDYELTLPGGGSESGRLIGGTLLLRPGEYQAGGEASVSVKTVYELSDGSNVSSAEATLTCTVGE